MNIVAVLGHTASGKSEIAEAVATRFGAEIISVDSMQVYRGMDIGTAKPPRAVQDRIPHHMVDIVEPSYDYTVGEFQTEARRIVSTRASEARVLIAGGSGLHFRSIVDPLTFAPSDPDTRCEIEAMSPQEARDELLAIDPEAPSVVDMANPRRVTRAIEVARLTGETPTARARTEEAKAVAAYEPLIPHVSIGIDAGDTAHDRAERRFDQMMAGGLLGEVESLAGRLGRSAGQAVGYKELFDVVTGLDTLETGVARAKASTRQLIKRQRTYFGRDPRIAWLSWQDDVTDRIDAATRHIEKEASWTS